MHGPQALPALRGLRPVHAHLHIYLVVVVLLIVLHVVMKGTGAAQHHGADLAGAHETKDVLSGSLSAFAVQAILHAASWACSARPDKRELLWTAVCWTSVVALLALLERADGVWMPSMGGAPREGEGSAHGVRVVTVALLSCLPVVTTHVVHLSMVVRMGSARAGGLWDTCGLGWFTVSAPLVAVGRLTSLLDPFPYSPVVGILLTSTFYATGILGVCGASRVPPLDSLPLLLVTSTLGLLIVSHVVADALIVVRCVSPGIVSSYALLVAFKLVLQAHALSWHVFAAYATTTSDEQARADAERDAIKAELHAEKTKLRMKDAADVARQRFMRYVFHEVRVPFNSIDIGLGLLADMEAPHLSEEGRITLDMLINAAAGMKVILSDTLDFSKIEGGAFQLHFCPTKVRDIVQATTLSMLPMAAGADNRVTLVCNVDPRLPRWMLADKVRLQQVLANLVSNGIKFAPHDGKGTVTLTALVLPDAFLVPMTATTATTSTGMSSGAKGGADPVGEWTHVHPSYGGAGGGVTFDFQGIHWCTPEEAGLPGGGVGGVRLTDGSPLDTDVKVAAGWGVNSSSQEDRQGGGSVESFFGASARPAVDAPFPSTTSSSSTTSRHEVDGGAVRGLDTLLYKLLSRCACRGKRAPAVTPFRESVPLDGAGGKVPVVLGAGQGIFKRLSMSLTRGGVQSLPPRPKVGGCGEMGCPFAWNERCMGRLPSLPGLSVPHIPHVTSTAGGEGEEFYGPPPATPLPTPLHPTVEVGGPFSLHRLLGAGSGGPAPSPPSLCPSPHPTSVLFLMAVKDNGEGIPRNDLKLLFQPFKQLDAGLQYKGKGTGLGLAICREIVAKHGGRIGVRSSGVKGEGAEFIALLRLPVLGGSSMGGSVDAEGSTTAQMSAGRYSTGAGAFYDGSGGVVMTVRSPGSETPGVAPGGGASTPAQRRRYAGGGLQLQQVSEGGTGGSSGTLDGRGEGEGAGGAGDSTGPQSPYHSGCYLPRLDVPPPLLFDVHGSDSATGRRPFPIVLLQPTDASPEEETVHRALTVRVRKMAAALASCRDLESPLVLIASGHHGGLSTAIALPQGEGAEPTYPSVRHAWDAGEGRGKAEAGWAVSQQEGAPPRANAGEAAALRPVPLYPCSAAAATSPPADALVALGREGGEAGEPSHPSTPRPLRLLVVDDVLENRRLLGRALKNKLQTLGGARAACGGVFTSWTGARLDVLRVEVTEAADGHLAVEAVTGWRPDVTHRRRDEAGVPPSMTVDRDCLLRYDVVTMDAEMPSMSGFVATRILRAAGFGGRIFGCTGNALEEDQTLFRASGVDDVFVKPVPITDLSAAILRAVESAP